MAKAWTTTEASFWTMSLRTTHSKPSESPEIITLISDDDDESEQPPVSAENVASPVRNIILTSPPHTPGRLSLAYGKTVKKELDSSIQTARILSLNSTPWAKNNVKADPILIKIDSHRSGTAILIPKSPVSNEAKNSTLNISVATPDLSDSSKPSTELSPQALKLLDIINKVNMRKEIQQSKLNAIIQLPIPTTGSLTSYQAPDNEVHSSTGADDAKDSSILKFFETCRKFSRDKEDSLIVEKMWKRVDKCDSMYTNSKEFLQFTRTVHLKLLDDQSNLHVYLKEFYDGLIELRSSCNSKNSTAGTDNDTCGGPSTSHNNSGSNEPDTTSNEAPIEKRILILEKLLRKCSKKIKKYEEREMSLDDLDDEESTYLLIDRYKKRSLDVWRRLNDLTGQKSLMGRVTEKKFSYEGSRYPEINKAISRLVSKTKDFPDYSDVVDSITSCCEQYDLHLRPTLIENIAAEAFKDIGKELKRRRILDYEEHYGCPLFDLVQLDNDPAYQDESLQATLVENRKLARKKTDEVFEEYVLKQADLDIRGVKSGSENELSDDGDSQSQDEESDADDDDDAEKEIPVNVLGIESDSASECMEDEAEENIAEEEEDNIEDEAEDSLDIEYEDSIDIEYVNEPEPESEEENDDRLLANIKKAIDENVADLRANGEFPLSSYESIPEENVSAKPVSPEHGEVTLKRRPSSDLENPSPAKLVNVQTVEKIDVPHQQENIQANDESSDSDVIFLD